MILRAARPDDAEAIARIHVEGWQNYRGLMPDEEIDSRTFGLRLHQWRESLSAPRIGARNDRITYVACDAAGDVLGFASAFAIDPPDHGFDAYLQTLYVRHDSQKRGVGRALLLAIARRFQATGHRALALRTLRRNPARAFYERLGARCLGPEGVAADRGLFDDVAYGFDDLSALLTGTRSQS